MKKYLIIASFGFLFSCGNSGDPDQMSKSDRLEVIRELEDKSYQDIEKFDTTMALSLVNNYAKFADENPEDELTPNFLFKAGDLSMALHKPSLAISYFDRIISNYADYEKLPYCMFLKGFIYEDQIGDLKKAKANYEEFIERFPDHDMTEAARFSIKNLGKSPEELIREFEGQQDSTQAEI